MSDPTGGESPSSSSRRREKAVASTEDDGDSGDAAGSPSKEAPTTAGPMVAPTTGTSLLTDPDIKMFLTSGIGGRSSSTGPPTANPVIAPAGGASSWIAPDTWKSPASRRGGLSPSIDPGTWMSLASRTGGGTSSLSQSRLGSGPKTFDAMDLERTRDREGNLAMTLPLKTDEGGEETRPRKRDGIFAKLKETFGTKDKASKTGKQAETAGSGPHQRALGSNVMRPPPAHPLVRRPDPAHPPVRRSSEPEAWSGDPQG